jgi:glycosyltransferase involved in cell wall biosynthesis
MRVAIWIYGGIGGGNFSQGTPTLNHFIAGISKEYRVTVYSILPSNPGFTAKNFSFRSAPGWIAALWLRMVFLAAIFTYDHLKSRYRIIHGVWLYPAAMISVVLGRILGIKSIASAHGGEAAAIPAIGYGNMMKSRSKKWTLWTCNKATALNFISAFQLREMRRHGLTRTDYSVISFGANAQLFYPIQKRISDKVRILHVANLTEVKDQETLLRSFKQIVSVLAAEMRIVGPDYMDGKLQNLARELKIDSAVTFVGPVEHNDILQHYHWADIMLHTSLYEGLPSVIIEAMASGIPVVATPTGIVADLGPEFFEIIPFGDHQAISDQVIKLLNDESRRLAMSTRSLDWAKTHDIKWTINKFSTLYKSLVN